MKLHGMILLALVLGLVFPKPVFSQTAHQEPANRIESLRKTSEEGEAVSQCELAKTYLESGTSNGKYVEALKWFRKSADQGFAEAQEWMGLMYEAGLGVNQDYPEAEKWYLKAAEQGNASAQLNLGFMYQHGRGRQRVGLQSGFSDPSAILVFDQPSGVVYQDLRKAAVWYRRAAEQGSDLAQSNLGWMYARGWGVAQNNVEAAKWFEAAAQQGDMSAKCMLGAIYVEGKDVPRDLVKAHYWLDLCAASAAGVKRDMALKIRDTIAAQIGPQPFQESRERTGVASLPLPAAGGGRAPMPTQGVTVPVGLISPNPAYTEKARRDRTQGAVLMECVVRTTGRVDSCRLLRELGSGLDDSAINTIRTMWRFKPASYNGDPIDYPAAIEVVYKLY